MEQTFLIWIKVYSQNIDFVIWVPSLQNGCSLRTHASEQTVPNINSVGLYFLSTKLITFLDLDNTKKVKDPKCSQTETILKNYDYFVEKKETSDGKVQSVYICDYKDCRQEFMRKGNLLDHAYMHAGIRPFSCPNCDKNFTQKSNLKKHMKVHLKPELEQRKRFFWELWESSYTERYNYKVNRNHSILNFCQPKISNFNLITPSDRLIII